LDYFATSGVLTFGAGMMSRTFTVPILNDTLDEPSETVTLTLSSPGGGATLGTPSTARLTIVDNDPAGPVAPQGERRKGLGIGYPRSSSR
jgi:hypothetical protein